MNKSLRVLKIPEMNFEIDAYYEIIYWPNSNAGVCQNIDYANPPMVRMINDDRDDD